jgi:hypothetical protein
MGQDAHGRAGIAVEPEDTTEGSTEEIRPTAEETAAREATWWTADMPQELRMAWNELRVNSGQFVAALPILALVARFLSTGSAPTPPVGSSFYVISAALFGGSVAAVAGGVILRRRLMPRPGVPGRTATVREQRAASAVSKATFISFMFAQAPNLIGFVLLFEGLPYPTYLGFVAVSAIGFGLYYPTRARWSAAMHAALEPAS